MGDVQVDRSVQGVCFVSYSLLYHCTRVGECRIVYVGGNEKEKTTVRIFPDEIVLGNLVIMRSSVHLCQRKFLNKHLRLNPTCMCSIVYPVSSFEELCPVYLSCQDISGFTQPTLTECRNVYVFENHFR